MIHVFTWTLCIFLTILVIFRFWKEWRLDCCRYELFELRDKLFFYGIDNKILDTPDYRNAERYINTAINAAEKLSSSYFITMLILMEMGKIKPPYISQRQVLGAEKRRKLEGFKDSCMDIIVDYVQQFSLIMLAVSAVYFVSHFAKARNAGSSRKRREMARHQKRQTFSEAFICSENSLATETI